MNNYWDSIKLVSAGVDPNHQMEKCDHCKKTFTNPDDVIKTCSHSQALTLCEKCYKKAGNSVR